MRIWGKWLAAIAIAGAMFAPTSIAETPESASPEILAATPIPEPFADSNVTECAYRGWGPSVPRYDWRDTLSLFLGLESSKQPQDLGINSHFGGRTAVNWGAPLIKESGLGVQLGAALNATSNADQEMQRIEGTSSRTQLFTTLGCFQRDVGPWKWAAAYDFLYEDYYDDFALGQFRGLVGYKIGEMNELGIKASVRTNDDHGQFANTDVTLRPINQGSVYFRHTFENLTQLGISAGIAEGHSQPHFVLGDLPAEDTVFVYGGDLFVPLNDYIAIFGEANFLTPADTGAIDAYIGIELFCWGGAKESRHVKYAPVLSVAGNTSFCVDVLR